MKTLFLLLELLTNNDVIRNVLHSCFIAGVFSVAILFLLVTYQVLRCSCARRTTAAPSAPRNSKKVGRWNHEQRILGQALRRKETFRKDCGSDGLDLQVSAGELFSVLGPNGAGKSTAISLLLGLLKPDSGAARLFGLSPFRVEARRRVGVMMQEVTLAPELRVREHVALVASYYPHPFTPAEAMELTNISSLASRPYGKLSAGQKRQVQFTMAVCGRPKLLFLDEPSVGLDIRAREMMWATLRRLVGNGLRSFSPLIILKKQNRFPTV